MIFIGGLAIFLFLALNALTGSFAYKNLLKPAAIFFVLVAGISAYFTDTFGTIIDRAMINNALATDQAEASELLTLGLLFHVMMFVALPVALIFWVRVRFEGFKKTYFQNVGFVTACLVGIALIVLPNFSAYASIARNHRDMVKVLNPSQPIFALVQVATDQITQKDLPLVTIGNDAHIDPDEAPQRKPKLVVLVLGETARAQSFSLNGYAKKTNPELEKLDVFNFSNVASCGTATAVSVPCMFSHFGKENYSSTQAAHTENVIDIISRAGVQVTWFNNNSGSKGQADRVSYIELKNATDPRFCSADNCFDAILLSAMQDHVATLETADTLIVLHQLGSHGPSYYKRVPQEQKVFFPECATAELQKCSREEIINSYDNTIHYTDKLLGNIIEYLKSMETRFDTAMLYVSDHGESTGEYGLYLHGMPYALAPEEQTHIPMIAWLSKNIVEHEEISRSCMDKVTSLPLSQDNMFHTLLELIEVDTAEYNPQLDVFNACSDDAASDTEQQKSAG